LTENEQLRNIGVLAYFVTPPIFFCCRCAAHRDTAWRTSGRRLTLQAFTFKITS